MRARYEALQDRPCATQVTSESAATVSAALASGSSGTIENVFAGFDRGRAEFALLKVTDAPEARVTLSLASALASLRTSSLAATVALRACVAGEELTARESQGLVFLRVSRATMTSRHHINSAAYVRLEERGSTAIPTDREDCPRSRVFRARAR